MTTQTAVKSFYEAVENRRSIYAISPETVVSDDRLEQLIGHAMKHAPSAFNSQSARTVLLLGGNHAKLWSITTETLRKIVPADNFGPTQDRMDAFGRGYGTVLFFEDEDVVRSLQNQFPSYKEKFPEYSAHSSGMLQYIVWTALENEGFGASLQHYNPLIDEEVRKTWSLPASWKLVAQMPFGKPTGGPNPNKQFQPLEDRMKVFK